MRGNILSKPGVAFPFPFSPTYLAESFSKMHVDVGESQTILSAYPLPFLYLSKTSFRNGHGLCPKGPGLRFLPLLQQYKS